MCKKGCDNSELYIHSTILKLGYIVKPVIELAPWMRVNIGDNEFNVDAVRVKDNKMLHIWVSYNYHGDIIKIHAMGRSVISE